MPNRSSEAHLRNKSSFSRDFGQSYIGQYDVAVASSNGGTSERQSPNERHKARGKVKPKKFVKKETDHQLKQSDNEQQSSSFQMYGSFEKVKVKPNKKSVSITRSQVRGRGS
jgi:hypothetical protein